ncbi:hypothetical protein EHQ42_01885 [Leptospira levettii]|uniref:hypothetical protein n=1 Tax=Leptospira levettii TaxID=2023178 RepID=UPI001083B793|nr:hypothetical protein [Leptospira levettii]TGL25382.1 hypothetical protein EHQ42_01885 [Leptospira levettii]
MLSWDKHDLDKLAKIHFENQLLNNSDELKAKYAQANSDLKMKIEVVEECLKHLVYNKWDDMTYLWNLTGFILMVSLDLKIYIESILFAEGYGKRELHFKNLCVLIYETSEDIEQLIGKKFFEICEKYKISNDLLENLKASKKRLSNFKKDHSNSLKSVRTIIGAHRDHDFLLQSEILKSFSLTAFVPIFTEFDAITNELSFPLGKINTEAIDKFAKLLDNTK